MSGVEAERLRALSQSERDVAAEWLDEGNLDAHRAQLREALRLEVLSRHPGELTALECATAVVMTEVWHGADVNELLAACREVLANQAAS